MNKAKLLDAVITTSAAMTGLCAEISHNVISENDNFTKIQPPKKTISKTESKGNKNEI